MRKRPEGSKTSGRFFIPVNGKPTVAVSPLLFYNIAMDWWKQHKDAISAISAAGLAVRQEVWE
jgi:hypothetical protein